MLPRRFLKTYKQEKKLQGFTIQEVQFNHYDFERQEFVKKEKILMRLTNDAGQPYNLHYSDVTRMSREELSEASGPDVIQRSVLIFLRNGDYWHELFTTRSHFKIVSKRIKLVSSSPILK